MSGNNETVVLLLPDIPDIGDLAKDALLKQHGVMGVAVHSFSGIPNKSGQETQKWYCSVTFNSLRVSQERLREVVQAVTKGKRVIDVNKGKVKKQIAGKDYGPGKTEQFHLADDDDESLSTAEVAGIGGSNLSDNLHDWYHDNDSDSEDGDSSNSAKDEPTTGGNTASYLDEDTGKAKANVNFFAPIVGVFGIDGAQCLTEEYNNFSVQPWGIRTTEEKKKSSWTSYLNPFASK